MRRLPSIALLVTALAIMGCSPDDRSPEGAVNLLFRAVAMHDTAKIYKLLAPESHKKLERWAELATAQTGGRRPFKPEELLAPNLNQPRFRLGSIDTIKVDGDHATVQVTNLSGKKSQTFSLIKVAGSWRIILPKVAFDRHAATSPRVPPTSSSPTTSPSPATAVTTHSATSKPATTKPATPATRPTIPATPATNTP